MNGIGKHTLKYSTINIQNLYVYFEILLESLKVWSAPMEIPHTSNHNVYDDGESYQYFLALLT